jgi:hypothetical protein
LQVFRPSERQWKPALRQAAGQTIPETKTSIVFDGYPNNLSDKQIINIFVFKFKFVIGYVSIYRPS